MSIGVVDTESGKMFLIFRNSIKPEEVDRALAQVGKYHELLEKKYQKPTFGASAVELTPMQRPKEIVEIMIDSAQELANRLKDPIKNLGPIKEQLRLAFTSV